jgi:hypothetical protein
MRPSNPQMLILGNPGKKRAPFHYPKGSPEAREYMARLRAMRGAKKNPMYSVDVRFPKGEKGMKRDRHFVDAKDPVEARQVVQDTLKHDYGMGHVRRVSLSGSGRPRSFNPAKLLTLADRRMLPPIRSQESKGMDAIAYVKFFTPDGQWTWYATEFDGQDEFFGLVKGLETELGYFSLSELSSIRGRMGLPVERDRFFRPTPLSRLKNYTREGNPSSPFHRKTNPRRKKLGDFPRVVSRALPEVDPVCDYCGTDELVYMGQMGRGTHAYRCRRCGMDKVTREENPRYRKLLRHGRKLNPTMRGIPSWMANDPSFRQELAAYTKRHGRGPVRITQVKVPVGYPKYMSVYGKAPEIKYDAPSHSNKGRRIHKFGEGGGRPPWLATSVSRGPKFLSFVGGTFKAKDWIYK